MKRSALSLFAMLAVCTISVQAAECVAPVLPAHSTSTEGVNRIVKKVQQWRTCQAELAGNLTPAEAARQQADFDAKLAKWERGTRMYSDGQALGALSHSSLERDRREHLAAATNPQPQVFGSERR